MVCDECDSCAAEAEGSSGWEEREGDVSLVSVQSELERTPHFEAMKTKTVHFFSLSTP